MIATTVQCYSNNIRRLIHTVSKTDIVLGFSCCTNYFCGFSTWDTEDKSIEYRILHTVALTVLLVHAKYIHYGA